MNGTEQRQIKISRITECILLLLLKHSQQVTLIQCPVVANLIVIPMQTTSNCHTVFSKFTLQ